MNPCQWKTHGIPDAAYETHAWSRYGYRFPKPANILGVSRQALNNVITGISAISPEMAIRLTKAFGSTEETWLRMQLAYDLAEARKHAGKTKVHRQHVEEVNV